MATESLWRSRPVFVTSTFRDFHAERDHLRDFVFPDLEARLRERRCHLESIDLRWGVETKSAKEEQAKALLVLKVCLDEVKRSRPFLIGLLGTVKRRNRMRQPVRRLFHPTGSHPQRLSLVRLSKVPARITRWSRAWTQSLSITFIIATGFAVNFLYPVPSSGRDPAWNQARKGR